MEIIDNFASKSTIHGVSDWASAKSWRGKIFWTLILLGGACIFPWSIVQLFQDAFENPIMTYINWEKRSSYEYPIMRFCPRAWINTSRVDELRLSKDALAYALSLLYNVRILYKPINVDKAEEELRNFMKERNMTDYLHVYSNITYTSEKLFECKSCAQGWPAFSLTIAGACYNFKFKDFTPTDISDQGQEYSYTYYEPSYNRFNRSDSNSMYDFKFTMPAMAMDVHPQDSFSYDPIFLMINNSYEVTITPRITSRLPETGRRKCVRSENHEKSIEMCVLNEREDLLGHKCWGYMRFLVAADWSEKARNGLPLYSALKHVRYEENETIRACESATITDISQVMNLCRSICRRWKYDFTIKKAVGDWNFESANSNSTEVTVAEWVSYNREKAKITRNSQKPRNRLKLKFNYVVTRGVNVNEEIATLKPSRFISNVGGWMGLMAGVSTLSIFQLSECLIRLCLKYKRREYDLS